MPIVLVPSIQLSHSILLGNCKQDGLDQELSNYHPTMEDVVVVVVSSLMIKEEGGVIPDVIAVRCVLNVLMRLPSKRLRIW